MPQRQPLLDSAPYGGFCRRSPFEYDETAPAGQRYYIIPDTFALGAKIIVHLPVAASPGEEFAPVGVMTSTE
jgi:hypothetical protein